MGRTHDVLISEFDLDRLEADLSAAERSAAEQTRRANENHAWALRAERERDTERALADLLASSLLLTLSAWITSPDAERAAASLRVWKEARSE